MTLSEAYSVVSSFSPPSRAQTTLLKAELAFYTVVSPSNTVVWAPEGEEKLKTTL